MPGLQIFICRRQHQFDSVQLVYLACTRIKIYGYNIRLWIKPSKFLDYALADHMVGEAGKRLGAHNIGSPAFNKL